MPHLQAWSVWHTVTVIRHHVTEMLAHLQQANELISAENGSTAEKLGKWQMLKKLVAAEEGETKKLLKALSELLDASDSEDEDEDDDDEDDEDDHGPDNGSDGADDIVEHAEEEANDDDDNAVIEQAAVDALFERLRPEVEPLLEASLISWETFEGAKEDLDFSKAASDTGEFINEFVEKLQDDLGDEDVQDDFWDRLINIMTRTNEEGVSDVAAAASGDCTKGGDDGSSTVPAVEVTQVRC